MTEQDRQWIEKCKENKDKYTIMVDNDCIFVVDNEKDEDVYTFNEYGYYFARDLLHYIGCNTDFV
jgi:hypothetical protein